MKHVKRSKPTYFQNPDGKLGVSYADALGSGITTTIARHPKAITISKDEFSSRMKAQEMLWSEKAKQAALTRKAAKASATDKLVKLGFNDEEIKALLE